MRWPRAPHLRDDLRRLFAEPRRQPTLVWGEPIGCWDVIRYADALEVFENPLDPPRHSRPWALVHHDFGQAASNRLEPHIHAYAQRAASELPLGRRVDIIDSLAPRGPRGLTLALRPE